MYGSIFDLNNKPKEIFSQTNIFLVNTHKSIKKTEINFVLWPASLYHPTYTVLFSIYICFFYILYSLSFIFCYSIINFWYLNTIHVSIFIKSTQLFACAFLISLTNIGDTFASGFIFGMKGRIVLFYVYTSIINFQFIFKTKYLELLF